MQCWLCGVCRLPSLWLVSIKWMVLLAAEPVWLVCPGYKWCLVSPAGYRHCRLLITAENPPQHNNVFAVSMIHKKKVHPQPRAVARCSWEKEWGTVSSPVARVICKLDKINVDTFLRVRELELEVFVLMDSLMFSVAGFLVAFLAFTNMNIWFISIYWNSLTETEFRLL